MSWNLDERRPFTIFASQKLCLAHAHAPFTWTIAMRTPLLCTCASYCLAHARPIALRMRRPLYRSRPQFANMRPGQLNKWHCLFEFCQKWFTQYLIQYCFTQDSIQNIIQFKINSGDSIQNIIQFNSQGMINTGRIGKVPKNWPKSVQNRQKRGLIIKNGKYRFKNWVIHSFHDKIQFKGLFNIIFSGIFNSKNYSIIFFPRKFNSKIYSKFLIWLDSIQ